MLVLAAGSIPVVFTLDSLIVSVNTNQRKPTKTLPSLELGPTSPPGSVGLLGGGGGGGGACGVHHPSRKKQILKYRLLQ